MRLGIMQPYFFPYIGYFSLIKHTDSYILLDKVQFIRHGWIERNRILKQTGGWCYISVPLRKHSRDTLISDIEINTAENWKRKIISQLQHYKGAPYYYKTMDLVKNVLNMETKSIVDMDLFALQQVCNYLNISTPINVFSEMDLQIEKPVAADEWALNICCAIDDVTEYWNPIGGKEFFDCKKYIEKHIEIYFQQIHIEEYKQNENDFEPGLSIIDVMMFNSPEKINKMLDGYELVR